MAVHEIRIDFDKPLAAEPHTGHNRWHPDVKPALRCRAGDEVVIDARDANDLQLTRDSSANDLAALDLGVVHPLTGPIYVENAEPGDLLAVEILDVSTGSFGFTAQVPGVGFLRDEFPDAHLTRWDIADGWATSPDIHGIRVPGAPFMGIMGVAPSVEMVDRVRAREEDVARRGGFVLPPDPKGAVPFGGIVGTEGLRTIPPRENGGNVDIKHLTAGTTVLIPVFVEGALFSAGDGHFDLLAVEILDVSTGSFGFTAQVPGVGFLRDEFPDAHLTRWDIAQGDGEVCGTAIETSTTLHARFAVRKGGATDSLGSGIRFEQPTRAPHIPGPIYATTGISVDSEGVGHAENLTLAARNAALAMIDYLEAEYGYTREQAYTICSVVVDLQISEVVDLPNFVATALLPLAVLGG